MTAQKKLLNKLLIICAIAALPFSQAYSEEADAANSQDDTTRVRLVTSLGDIVLELNATKAPKTVENFLAYVNEGFYSGTIFHRVIDGFMIQGGGFTKDFQKLPTRNPIENEANNGLKNLNGTVAMARTNNPHSATAQFFINVADNGFLDHRSPTPRGWGYTVFGKVVEGLDVINIIRRNPTSSGGPFRKDVPRTPIVIQSASIDGSDNMASDSAPAMQQTMPPADAISQ